MLLAGYCQRAFHPFSTLRANSETLAAQSATVAATAE
jgi:hypothetical protein